MTSSDDLSTTWAALGLEPESRSGLYERRVFAHSGFAVFVGLLRPGGQLRLSVEVPAAVGTDGLERETKGFRVTRQYIASEQTTRVSMELIHTSFRELFVVMAEDVARRILAATSESSAVAAMRERLNHWERFMSASGPEGLSRERQVGLFGELTFLKTLLSSGVPAATAVTWWRGPASENQDFLAGRGAVEVKTTTGNSATLVRIANELQLDDTDCVPLHLFHLWLKEAKGSGTSLPRLIDEVGAALVDVALTEFTDRLGEAGYHEVHRGLYEDTGYVERRRRYYEVTGDFPRIGRPDLRPGVSRVEYGIELSGFEGYVRDEALVIASFQREAR